MRWEINVKNGVVDVQFDRWDIPMNKFVATCLESQFHTFDARTQHASKVSDLAILGTDCLLLQGHRQLAVARVTHCLLLQGSHTACCCMGTAGILGAAGQPPA